MSMRPIPPSSGRFRVGFFRQTHQYSNFRPHGSGDWLLIYTLEGTGRYVEAGNATLTQPGDATLYSPTTPQDYGLAADGQPWSLLWAHFQPRPEWLPLLAWPAEAGGLRRVRLQRAEARAAVEAALQRMVHAYDPPTASRQLWALNALEYALLWLASEQPAALEATDERIATALRFLRAHLAEAITVGQLARVAGLSLSRFSERFREVVGLSPMAHLEKLRMERARELLETTPLPVSRIAELSGFADPFYFTRRFRRHWGVPPRAAR